MTMRRTLTTCLALHLCLAPALAQQVQTGPEQTPELPNPVRDMIEAAIATGDKTKVQVVVDLARETNPSARGAIETLYKGFLDREAESAARQAAEAKAAPVAAASSAHWTGKGEFGASRATGTSSDLGLTAGITLERKGTAWTHKLRAQIDYQNTNGATSRERYFAAYEPRYAIHNNLFTYALAQFERDRVQGFGERYTASGGLGYKVIDGKDVNLAIKGGPTFRYTQFRNDDEESRAGALLGVDFGWAISPRVKLTQGINAVSEGNARALLIVDSDNTSLDLTSALDTKMSERLALRLSYQVNYNSNTPASVVTTSTLSRFSLVYGF
jgi:putative salt-induced outer membrane protein